MFNRRQFLSRSSVAVAGASVVGWRTWPLPIAQTRSADPVAVFFPDPVDPATLRTVATAGIEAAKSEGASYADIRVADRRMLQMMSARSATPESILGVDYAYGIRVRIGGVWGFAYGTDPTSDGVAQAAKTAAANAKALASIGGTETALAPAPVVTGEWKTPLTTDPFSVSPDDHANALKHYDEIANSLTKRGVGLSWYWLGETRVFASTEGSLITQHLAQARPQAHLGIQLEIGLGPTMLATDLAPAAAGFEITQGTALGEQIQSVTGDFEQLLGYPTAPAAIGRYEAVLDGRSVGALLGATVAPALELDRVLGTEVNDAGTSYLAPSSEILGRPIFSTALNVNADRTPPHLGAAQWDDEGVATETFPLIEHGKVVNYFVTRSTAPRLATWYAKQGQPVSSRGSAVSWLPTRPPVGTASSLVVAAGSAGASLDALVKGLGEGLLVRGLNDGVSDCSLGTGICYPPLLFEVRGGQITHRVLGANAQFNTKVFWKTLIVLGDASSVQTAVCDGAEGEPWAPTVQAIAAPAAHIAELDVIDIQDRYV